MKVKDLERTANVAWSPKQHSPILLAAGTAAQQLDASFNTNAALEIYSLNLAEPGLDLKQECSFPSEQRFHKIIWGACGESPAGTIIGGCDSGTIKIFSASKLLKSENGLVMTQQKHTGQVHALDFNPFQSNLFATGASESEIFIWDMNNPHTPMTPGSKSQPLEDVLSLSWNRQVQHILASTFSSKCVIWDLRKNEPIIKLTDTVSRVRWKMVAWHPEVATQLCLASEEDHSPVVQIWDLRFATSPLKTLENHQRGVLSIAWCSDDPDLLVSCGKDNRILCWNPNSNQNNGEVLAEIAKTNQWNFDIVWCPKNPAVIACPSFDGHISIYSLMGGKTQQFQTSNKIADSFPGMEGYVQAPVIQPQNLGPTSVDLTKPPKWLKRPVGASFSFGGRLVTFENDKTAIAQAQQQQQQPNQQNGNVASVVRRPVLISQVITEPELTRTSRALEEALELGNFTDYCRNKADETTDQHKKYVWHFIKANFEDNFRAEILDLLGYKIEDVNGKLNEAIGKDRPSDEINELNKDFNNMNRIEDFDLIANAQQPKKPSTPFKISTGNDTDGMITQALLLGNVEAAVELCLKAKKFADAIIIAMTGGSDLLVKTQRKYLEQSEGHVSSLISALVTEDWAAIINDCHIDSWKEALAATLTHASDEDLPLLCERLGNRLESEGKGNAKILEDARLCYICAGSFDRLVDSFGDKAYKSTEDLQEVVEIIMFLKRAVERRGVNVQLTGSLADILSNYAMILASQGDLPTALAYLASTSNEKVAELRQRLLMNLGQKQQQQQDVQYSRHNSRHSVGRQSFTNNTGYPYGSQSPFAVQNNSGQYGVQQSNFTGPPPPLTASTFNQPQQNINTSLPGAPAPVQQQPWQMNQNVVQGAPRTFSPAPPMLPPTQPPKGPALVGQSGVGTGLPSKKYVLDPSVSSNQYGSYPTRNPIVSNQPNSGYGAQQQPSFNTNPLAPAPSQSPAPSFNPLASNNMGAIPSLNPIAPNAIGGQNFAQIPPIPQSFGQMPANPQSFGQLPPNPGTDYGLSGNSMQQQQQQFSMPPPMVGQEAMESGGVTANLPPAAPGWNDPPVSNKPPRNPVKSETPQPQEPITHPLFGSAPVPSQPFNNQYDNNNGFLDNNFQAPPPPPPTSAIYQRPLEPHNAFQQQAPPPTGDFAPPPSTMGGYNPGNFIQNAVTSVGNVGNFDNNNAPNRAIETRAPEQVQKAPIPEEHLHMKTVFDELRNRCSCAAINQQMKRKIDDTGKKLEALYDLLRENKLSPNTLSSLHQMVQMIQNGNYQGGLSLHTQMISGPDFSQIANFMPGLKVLIQCANQLQVYLR